MRRAVAGSLLAVVTLTGCGSLRGERVMVGEDGGAVELSVPEPPEVVGDATPAGHEADAPAPVAPTSGAPVVAVQASVATPSVVGFAARDLDGGEVAGAELAAHGPLLMTFVQPTCPVSSEEGPKIAEAARRHPEITYVVVHSGGNADAYRAMATESGLDAANIVHLDDTDQRLWNRFGIAAAPSSILVDRAGLVRSSHGALGESGLERAAAALVSGF